MPKRYQEFDDYSVSHQNKLLRLYLDDSSDSLNSVDEDRVSQNSEPVSEPDSTAAEQNDDSDDNDSEPRSNHRNFAGNRDLEISDEGGFKSNNESIQSHISCNDEELNVSDNLSIDTSDTERSLPGDSEDDISSIESVNGVQRHNDELLYEGAPISAAESSIAILNLSLRHNMTDAQLTDILHIISLHCPPENNCKTTLYKFKKNFSGSHTPLTKHFYCTMCSQTVETQNSVCPSCNTQSKHPYFIEPSIIHQIQALFKRPGFRESLQYRYDRDRQNPNHYEDIYDGLVYKDLCKEGGFLAADRGNIVLSFTWYADGVRIFGSSNYNIWPVYLVINELPIAERTKKENIILAAFWFGDKKPLPNLLLDPLHHSMIELRQGIDVQLPNGDGPLKVKGIVICGTCDLQAKAIFLNMNQWNGRFGCQKCKNEGQYIQDSKVYVYPYRPLNLRTEEETDVHAEQAFNANMPVCGVKGPTILSTIVHQYLRATAVDVMHCVFEGVVKKLMAYWFSSTFFEHPSSIAQYLDLVDQRLQALTPPSFVQRLPRSIKDHLVYWKAHEFKAWFFYYSIPCVNDIMEQAYFEHCKLLVLGISLLWQSSVSPQELDIATRTLNEFVSRHEHLYGISKMSNNVHQLLHLPENVRQFGPLWTTSCFPFEDLNGRLKKMVRGSNSAHLQIYSTISMFLHLTSLKTEILVPGRPAFEFCKSLNSKHGRIKRHFIADSVYIVGMCTKLREIPYELERVLRDAEEYGASIFKYQRLLQNRVMYMSTEYRRAKRTNSSFAVYSVRENVHQIGEIRCFIRVTDCLCPGLCQCVTRNYALMKPCILENQFTSPIDGTVLSKIHHVLGFENDELAVDVTRLKTVCFYSKIQDKAIAYVVEPVNRIEWE